jgi:hypothetical protein
MKIITYKNLAIIFVISTFFLGIGFLNNYNYYQGLLKSAIYNYDRCNETVNLYQNMLKSNQANCTYFLNAGYERERGYNEIIEGYKNLLNASWGNCTEIIKTYQNVIELWRGNYTELATYCLLK